jgi:hypothetical protein
MATTATDDAVVTYRIRIDLDGTAPPLWRRLELRSDLRLDAVHAAIQLAIGWTDRHLHRFTSTREHDPDTIAYLSHGELLLAEDDDLDPIPEERVRLRDVMHEVGDALYYQYDYGDDWAHTLRLEAIQPRAPHAPAAVCTGGRRPGPPEDCGGVPGYELWCAATDVRHPGHGDALEELLELYGGEQDLTDVGLVPFDRDAVNLALAALDDQPRLGALPAPLDELHQRIVAQPQRGMLERLLADAELDQPVDVDPGTATRMVAAYRWLLQHVGPDGIKLTAAGYLPPAHVAAGFDALGLADEWIGAGNRELQTLPVLHLRESAQQVGLLRVARGRLLVTARGRAAADDPVALWWRLAECLPFGSRQDSSHAAGLLYLLTVAAGASDNAEGLIASLLAALGWRHLDGSAVSPMTVSRQLWDTRAVLRRLGVFSAGEEPRHRGQEPTPDGRRFARAALQRWS